MFDDVNPLTFNVLQKESLSDVQLHLAALQGDVALLRRVLDSGKDHVDSKDKVRTVLQRTEGEAAGQS
jgi:hypothetical protein